MMAQFPPKRRKLHHKDEETDSTDGISEGPSDAIAKQPPARQKHIQDIDESALYSGGLCNSSMFKLQIDEMLSQVHLNYEKRMPGVDEALRRLKTLIEAIEDREMLPVCHFSLMFYTGANSPV